MKYERSKNRQPRVKMFRCLFCDTKFKGSAGNRICARCKKKEAVNYWCEFPIQPKRLGRL